MVFYKKGIEYLKELRNCKLCEHRCSVNRLEGEKGICRIGISEVASAQLHPAPPKSYTVFMSGCNFRCLNCQNWSISQYPDNKQPIRGYVDPKELAKECLQQLNSFYGKLMGADRIFFSGGEPTIHLPYIERVVKEARKINPRTKVNFDTNGFSTKESLKRVLNFTTSITYDLKAFNDEMHKVLTGCSSEPVLRNAEFVAKRAKNKLWEFRILVIPKINEQEIKPLSEFIASIDKSLPVCFLAFRPNFVLEKHAGASYELMDKCVEIAKSFDLENVYWSGSTNIPGGVKPISSKVKNKYKFKGAKIAATYALNVGCATHPRDCEICKVNKFCKIKRHIPARIT